MRAGILDNVIELYNPTYQDTGYGHKDEVYNLLICKLFDLPSAIEIYKSLGFKYV